MHTPDTGVLHLPITRLLDETGLIALSRDLDPLRINVIRWIVPATQLI